MGWHDLRTSAPISSFYLEEKRMEFVTLRLKETGFPV
jgi:hypothetical protein